MTKETAIEEDKLNAIMSQKKLVLTNLTVLIKNLRYSYVFIVDKNSFKNDILLSKYILVFAPP